MRRTLLKPDPKQLDSDTGKVSGGAESSKPVAYVESLFEIREMVIEELDDFGPYSFLTGNLHAFGSSRCNVDHFLESRMIKGFNWLKHGQRYIGLSPILNVLGRLPPATSQPQLELAVGVRDNFYGVVGDRCLDWSFLVEIFEDGRDETVLITPFLVVLL